MKKLFGILIIGLLLSGNLNADIRYSDLEKLSYSSNLKDTLKVIKQLTSAFEIEIGLMIDCINHIKTWQEKSNHSCDKILERKDELTKLLDVISSQNFKSNLLSLRDKIDRKLVDFINPNELALQLDKLENAHSKFNEIFDDLLVLLKNL